MIRLIEERDYEDLFQLLNHDAISNYFILISYFGNLDKLAKVYGFFEHHWMVEDKVAAALYRKLGFVERTTLEKYTLRACAEDMKRE